MKSNLEDLYLNIKQCILILLKKYTIWGHNQVLLLLKKRTLFSKIPAVSVHESKRVSCCSQLWKRLYVKRAPPYSQFTSKTRAATRAYYWEHTTTAPPPPPPPFFHHYILFLCFSTKFWSSRLTRPTETRYYRAYITLHICVVVIKTCQFFKVVT